MPLLIIILTNAYLIITNRISDAIAAAAAEVTHYKAAKVA